MARLLLDALAAREELDLALRLVLDGARERSHGVEVLDLAARAELLVTGAPHGHVGVDAHRALFHLRVAHAGGQQDVAQLTHILLRLLGAAQIRTAHDLDERDAGAVVVDEGVVGAVDASVTTDVGVLPRVLFDVRSFDADAPTARQVEVAVDVRR